MAQTEDEETDEEDEEGGLIVHHDCDEASEAAPANPIAMLGGAIMRGWRTWM